MGCLCVTPHGNAVLICKNCVASWHEDGIGGGGVSGSSQECASLPVESEWHLLVWNQVSWLCYEWLYRFLTGGCSKLTGLYPAFYKPRLIWEGFVCCFFQSLFDFSCPKDSSGFYKPRSPCFPGWPRVARSQQRAFSKCSVCAYRHDCFSLSLNPSLFLKRTRLKAKKCSPKKSLNGVQMISWIRLKPLNLKMSPVIYLFNMILLESTVCLLS